MQTLVLQNIMENFFDLVLAQNDDEIIVPEDYTAKIVCDIINPISWSKDGLPLPLNVQNNMQYLSIPNVTKIDEGIYICTGAGTSQKKLIVAGT